MNRLPKLLLMALLPTILPTIASAEVVTDGSVGTATSLTGPNFAVTADLGRQRGANLFHSFSQFNIANGESATFSGPAEIANIISRVTGGDLSTIDGLLRSDIAGANLFLLNPAGVMFGANASLDISGSLHVSSADYLALGEQMERFLATPLQGEVLSTAALAAFGFLGSSAGAIQLQGANLTLTSGKTLTLAANGVELNNATVQIDQGQVSLASINGAGEVDIETGVISNTETLANITVSNQSNITVDGENGSFITIIGGELVLEDSELSASHGGHIDLITANDMTLHNAQIDTSFTGDGNAGKIDLQAKEGDILLTGGSRVTANNRIDYTSFLAQTQEETYKTHSAGFVTLDAVNIHLRDGAQIDASVYLVNSQINYEPYPVEISGGAGTIRLSAQENISLSGSSNNPSGILATTLFSDKGIDEYRPDSMSITAHFIVPGDFSAGSITIEAGQLLADGARISTSSSDVTGVAGGGRITINGGKLMLKDSELSASHGGYIDVTTTNDMTLHDMQIDTSFTSDGNAGDIDLQAKEGDILLKGGSITASNRIDYTSLYYNSKTHRAGSVTLDAANITLLDGAQIDASVYLIESQINNDGCVTYISGGAGDIRLSARENISLTGSWDNPGGILATTLFSEGGTATFSDEGVVILNDSASSVVDFISLSDGFAAGSITLEAGSLSLHDRVEINASAAGGGDVGSININVRESMDLRGQDGNQAIKANGLLNNTYTTIYYESGQFSSLLVGSLWVGDPGEITIEAGQLTLADGARISASSTGNSDAGHISLTIRDALELDGDGTEISVSFLDGPGRDQNSGSAGSIDITAQRLELSNSAAISAIAGGFGNAGNISLNISGDVILRDGAIISSLTDSVGLTDGPFGNIQFTQVGAIKISGKNLSLSSGATITTSTEGTYNAGNIELDISQAAIFSDARVTSATTSNDLLTTFDDPSTVFDDSGRVFSEAGDAGNISISANTLRLENGTDISTSSSGTERAGNISFEIAGDIHLSESFISTTTIDGFDPNNPAAIELVAGNLLLDGGSTITTNANGTANAGDIDLRVDSTIKLLDNSSLSTESTRGGGGQIKVLVKDLLYLQDSAMTTKVEQGDNQGNGGDIFVDPVFIVLNNSVITANAIDGNGGNITLIADYINQSTDSQITASSQLGIDGEITIDALDAQVNASEDSLSADFLDASQWQRQACAQRSGSDVSRFIITQRPLRPSPHDDWSVNREL